MAIPSTYTLMNHNNRAAHMTYSITVRPGWTPEMLQESRSAYIAACEAARDGKRLIDTTPPRHRAFWWIRNDYAPSPHGEARVQLFGNVAVQVAPGIKESISINCFTEHQTAQQLLDELWALVDALQMIEAVAVLGQAQPPQPATLRPSITTQDELNAYAEQHPYDDVTDMPNIKIRPSRQRVEVPSSVKDDLDYDRGLDMVQGI